MKQAVSEGDQICATRDVEQDKKQVVVALLPNAVKITIGLFSADFLCMLGMNTLRLPSRALPWVFVGILAAAVYCVYRSGCLSSRPPELFSAVGNFRLVILLLLLTLIYSCVRMRYALEMPLHQLANLSFDDKWHVQEINSLANSPRYPAQSSFHPDMYFSQYYAPWMLAAAIYRALPVPGFTIKAALFLCSAIYLFLIPLALADVALRLARTRNHFYWAFYWIVCWSGLSGLFSLVHPFQQNQWWMRSFGFELQFSTFSDLSIYVLHHLSAATALILSWYLWRSAPLAGNAFTVFACSLLAAFAFYSSGFVCLGAFPIALVLLFRSRGLRAHLAMASCSLSAALIAPLAWLYMRKPGGAPWILMPHPRWIHVPQWVHLGVAGIHLRNSIAFVVFFALLILSFPFVPWALSTVSRAVQKPSGTEKALVVTASAFLISTYFIGFPLGNNYAMRGAIIPIIVLAWICSKFLPPIRWSTIAGLLLVVGAFGSIQDIALSYSRALPRFQSLNTDEVLRLNRDRSYGTVKRSELSPMLRQDAEALYHLEKVPSEVISPGAPKDDDSQARDKQLESFGPCGLWKWQRNPEIPSETCDR